MVSILFESEDGCCNIPRAILQHGKMQRKRVPKEIRRHCNSPSKKKATQYNTINRHTVIHFHPRVAEIDTIRSMELLIISKRENSDDVKCKIVC
ncbi:hypothetical protein NPIL_343981 [Nephila pilipes]|uniref:Uncharacterized protein n=1 Tax=Nephila pilipes TaxID=299642 RepID=A0A8X6PR92_NEPPI|nr:hypothetical protein NPIL_343981 [Nephila pilipes]